MEQNVETGSWCIELWDQSDAVLKNNSDLNSQTETFYKFLKDITAMHLDIAKKYKKTVNTYMPKKKPGDDDNSLFVSFHELLNSFNSMALVHEKLSKEISETIVVEHKKLQDECLQSNQKQTKSRNNLYKHLDEGRKKIESSWLNYLNSYRNKQKAHEANAKAQADDALSRSEQTRYDNAYRLKEKEYCDRELSYATELKKFNDHRSKYYSGTLLNMITIIEEQESNRAVLTRKAIENLASKHKELFEELSQTTAATFESSKKIDYQRDLRLAIAKMKTDDLFPVDLPFLSLDKCPSSFLEGTVTQLYNYMVGLEEVVEKAPKHSTFGISIFKKPSSKHESVNITTPFINGLGLKNTKLSELTVLQVYMKIHEAKKIIDSTEKEIDASEKMMSLYQADTNLGDPETVKPRYQILKRKMYSLNNLIHSLEERYTVLGGDSARIKMEQKLDRTYSTTCDDQTGSIGSNVYKQNDSIHTSNGDFETDSDEDADTGIDTYSSTGQVDGVNNAPQATTTLASTVPAHVAIGIAVYEFEGNGELYLPCQIDERFYIVEKDLNNCGWTEVVTQQGKNGYVPTNFLKVQDD